MIDRDDKLIPYTTRLPTSHVDYLRKQRGGAARWLRQLIAFAIDREAKRKCKARKSRESERKGAS